MRCVQIDRQFHSFVCKIQYWWNFTENKKQRVEKFIFALLLAHWYLMFAGLFIIPCDAITPTVHEKLLIIFHRFFSFDFLGKPKIGPKKFGILFYVHHNVVVRIVSTKFIDSHFALFSSFLFFTYYYITKHTILCIRVCRFARVRCDVLPQWTKWVVLLCSQSIRLCNVSYIHFLHICTLYSYRNLN